LVVPRVISVSLWYHVPEAHHMFRLVLALLLIALAAPAADARARTSTSRRSSTRTAKSKATRTSKPRSAPRSSTKCASCARDSRGRIVRSTTAKHDFQKAHPCPSTHKTTGACPGYVIDHVVPLKRGGADSPSNMQWQTTAAAKAKDKVE
jgi:5-methylcytosine-specific restriction endonuclease McrA